MVVEVTAVCAHSLPAPSLALLEWLRIGLDEPPKRMSRESPTELLSVPFVFARVCVTAVR